MLDQLGNVINKEPLLIVPNTELPKPKKKKSIDDDVRAKLRAPMPPEAIDTIASKTYLSTIKAIYIVERLNDVFGIGRWNHHTQVVSDEDQFVLMKAKLELLDYDAEVSEQYGGHSYSIKGTDKSDAYKSAVTDSLSKCASYLEIGIEVFKGEVGKGGEKKRKTATPSKPINYVEQLKFKLGKLYPELKDLPANEREQRALKFIDVRTGIKPVSFKTMQPKQAQMILGALLSNNSK